LSHHSGSGSSGIGSVFHLTGELFNRTAGVNITHVPYRGVAKPMQDVAAGQIQLMHISLSSARGALAARSLRGGSSRRSPGRSFLKRKRRRSAAALKRCSSPIRSRSRCRRCGQGCCRAC
jgi:hypothetical protein